MFRSYYRTNMFNRPSLLITFSCNKSELIIFNTRSMVIHSTEKVLQTSLYRFVAVYITHLLAFIPKPWQVWYLKKITSSSLDCLLTAVAAACESKTGWRVRNSVMRSQNVAASGTLDHVISRSPVRGSRIAMWGHSLTG